MPRPLPSKTAGTRTIATSAGTRTGARKTAARKTAEVVADDAGAEDPQTKECVACAEEILFVAKKCRFCGEFQRKRGPNARRGVEDAGKQAELGIVAGLLGFLFAGIGLIVGIIWACGSGTRTKGLKMIGLAIAGQIFWAIVLSNVH
jgi:hypothetical protein